MKVFIGIEKAVACGAIVAGGFGLFGGACDSAAPRSTASDVGSVEAKLSLPSGAAVKIFHYELKGKTTSGMTYSTKGDIPLEAPGATPSVALGAPAGMPYVITLTATTTDGRACSGASDPFSITADQTSTATVNVTCAASNGNPGGVTVTGTVDNCPGIVAAAASSLIVAVGGVVELSATAGDIDPADVITYSWKADGGTFDKVDAATTKYHCPAAAGLQTITLEVADHMGVAGAAGGASGQSAAATTPVKCKTTAQVVVNCGLCGNGVLDKPAGEQCDPPNGISCDSVCQTVGGAGGAGGGAGGQGGGVGGAGGGG